jgi:hypothetical protein
MTRPEMKGIFHASALLTLIVRRPATAARVVPGPSPGDLPEEAEVHPVHPGRGVN